MEKRWSDLKTIPNYPVASGNSSSDSTDMDTYIQDLQRRLNQIVISLSDESAPVNLLQRVIPKLESRIKEARQRLSDLRAGNVLPDSSSGFQPRRITEEQAARNFSKLLQGAPIIIELKDGTSIGSFDLTAAPPSSDSFSLEFECPVCAETANSKFELRTHITKRHLVNVKALKRLKAQNLIGAQWEPFASQQIPMESILVQSLSDELEAGITKEALEVFNARVLRPETLRSWLGEVARIQESLSQSLPGAELRPYGSSCNGFATISSDIDLTLDVDVFSAAFKSSDLKVKIEDLFGVDETLDLAYKLIFDKLVVVLRHLSYVNIEERFEARIPIVKCINQDLGMEMDISLANMVAVENSRLLATYSEIDERAKQLGIAIKTWAKARRIGNPANHTLSSYSYLILLIAFLQRDLLLPNLQAEYDQEDRVMKGEFDCSFESDPELFHELAQQNRKSTGRLLFEFFKHYSVFDWRSNCVSIRLSQNLTKSEKQWTKTLIAIEDPFELKRNLGDVRDI